jgi:hypothetical protein
MMTEIHEVGAHQRHLRDFLLLVKVPHGDGGRVTPPDAAEVLQPAAVVVCCRLQRAQTELLAHIHSLPCSNKILCTLNGMPARAALAITVAPACACCDHKCTVRASGTRVVSALFPDVCSAIRSTGQEERSVEAVQHVSINDRAACDSRR